MQVAITVKFTSGAYVTSTVSGVRASSTNSSQRAADAFGEKYFGKGFLKATRQPCDETGNYRFVVAGTNLDPQQARNQRRSS